MAAVVERVDRL